MPEREKVPEAEPDLTLDEMLDLVTPENQHGLLWEVSAEAESAAFDPGPGAGEPRMETRGRIESVDGDLVIRVPSEFAAFLGFGDGREVRLRIDEGRLVINSVLQRRYTLDDLLNRSTEENRHPEVDWGPPVGNEVW